MRHLAAALTLFTRLPLWRWVEIPAGAYDTAVAFWPVAGWLTAAVTAAAFLGFSFLLPPLAAAAAALGVRLVLTGALHEDGLADFCDGFGGGRDRQQVLAIMKDSHIGAYGVIGLIVYYLIIVSLIAALAPAVAAAAIFAADPFAKMCASQVTNLLPYARPEGPKNRVSYRRMTHGLLAFNILGGLLPLIPLALTRPVLLVGAPFAAAAVAAMAVAMRRRIGGYTGDCCGATFLVAELSMLAAVTAVVRLLP